MKSKPLILTIVGAIVLIAIFTLASNDDSTPTPVSESKQQLTLSDVHGLEVAIDDPDKLYLPNHQGLYSQEADGIMEKIGSISDDFMGFAVSPSEPSVFYASGHPKTGGNFGVISTSDGGTSWEDISEGLDGPVDFHTMAIDNADDQLIYGYYRGALQRSLDRGASWQYLENAPDQIIQLSAGSSEGQLYVSTVSGLYVSSDNGETWKLIDSLPGTITAVEINPTNSTIFAYSVNRGLVISEDKGETWSEVDRSSSYGQVLYIASSKLDPQQVYFVTKALEIYESTDGGKTWRTRNQDA